MVEIIVKTRLIDIIQQEEPDAEDVTPTPEESSHTWSDFCAQLDEEIQNWKIDQVRIREVITDEVIF